MLSRTKRTIRGLMKWLEAEPPVPRPHRSRKLAVELLEVRLAPAVLTWNGSIDGSWSKPKNWDVPPDEAAARVPTNGDSLVFVGGQNVTSIDDMAGVTKLQALTINNGFTKAVRIEQALQIDGVLTLNDGFLSTSTGTGKITLPLEASSMVWNGGTLGLALQIGTNKVSGQTASFGGGAKAFGLSGALDNYGSVGWTAGDIASSIGTQIENEKGSVFNIQGGVNLTGGANVSAVISNFGLFEKTGGTAGSKLEAEFGNSATGQFLLQAGTLTLTGRVDQYNGLTSLQGGNLACAGFNLEGGKFTGAGTLTADLVNSGVTTTSTVYAGINGVGQLNIIGNYLQANTLLAKLQVDVSATGTVNVLNVEEGDEGGGTSTISGGTVIIRRDPAFVPPQGTIRTFIQSVVEKGTFKAIDRQQIGNSWTTGESPLLWWVPEVAGAKYNLIALPVEGPVIKGCAFNDANRNGIEDAGETAVSNVVTLTGSDEMSYTTTTASDGSYEFDGLTLGTTYTVSVSAVPNMTLEGFYQDDGTLTPSSFTPTAAQPVADIDAAFIASIGTTTSLSASLPSSAVGQAVTFTATVSPTSYGGPAPGGTVDFMDGPNLVASATLGGGYMGQVQASFTTTSLAAGSHTITAIYLGDPNYTGSSAAVAEAVTQPVATVYCYYSSGSGQPYANQAFTLTAGVNGPSGGPPVTGTVTFVDETTGTTLGTVALGAGMYGDQPSLTVTLAAGVHDIVAVYNGNDAYAAASGATQVTVQQATVWNYLWAQQGAGQSVTVTAYVAPNSPGVLPTGTVSIYADGVLLAVLDAASADAIHTVSLVATLAVGRHDLREVYSGDANFAGGSASTSFDVHA